MASAGSVCWDSRLMWIRSAIIRWSTSREALSSAIAGFSVFGSVRWAKTSRPPGCPVRPGTISTSSEAPYREQANTSAANLVYRLLRQAVTATVS